jgi:2-dehydro-3-deoxyphosphogluconate aldolase / (4S)-4-hydroxy-2-oxoglutarate aldolase
MRDWKMSAEKVIYDTGIAAVIRNATAENIVQIAEALSAGGVKVLEITVESAGAIEAIKVANKNCPDMAVGAGTVLDIQDAEMALDAGAEFIFSPVLDEKVVKYVKERNAISIPGAFSPTEIYKAHIYGADFVKVFPASILGPEFLKNIRIPLPPIPIIVTGGITPENARDFFQAGAIGIGAGSNLVDMKKANDPNFYYEISEMAKKYTKVFQNSFKNSYTINRIINSD